MSKNSAPKKDSLLECLVLYTRLYHKPFSAEALTHGLPVKDGRDFELFALDDAKSLMSRAAERAGLRTLLVKKEIKDISPLLLPAILLLKNREACIIDAFSENGKMVKVYLPDMEGEAQWVEIERLSEQYLGYMFLIKKEYSHSQNRTSRRGLNIRHWFWDPIKFSKKIYMDVIFASVLVNLFVLATPLFTRNVYDRVIPNNATETLWYFAGGVIVIYVLDLFLKFIRTYFLEIAGKKSDIIISSVLFEKVMDMKMAAMPQSIGSFASNLKDFDSIRTFLTSSTLTTIVDLPFAILFLFVIWYLGGAIIWVPVVTILLILLYALLIRKPLYKSIEETHQAAAHKNGILIEALHNLELIKTSGAAGQIQWKWEESVGEIAQKSLKSRLLSASIPSITSFLVQFNTVFVLVVGVYMIKENLMTMGDLIAIVILVSRTVSPMGQAASLIANYEDVKSVYSTLDDIVNSPQEREAGKEFVKPPDFKGKIEFKDVTFTYPGSEVPAIKNLSFVIHPKERVGIIGKIGSGKSTIEKLILGLYEPDSGSILIDDIDIKQIDPADLRKHISYVGQHLSFFRGSLKENILFGSQNTDDASMMQAAILAGVDDFAKRHPQGYDMQIGEQGRGLSGGQRQSVAIARAMLQNAPIVLMDEPSNAMDQTTERALIGRLGEFMDDSTLIIVTQKMSMLAIVDRVIVMHEGRLFLDGAKGEVMAKLNGDNGRG